MDFVINYGFFSLRNKWGTRYARLFKTVMVSLEAKIIYTLASNLINKWLKESCDESESDI